MIFLIVLLIIITFIAVWLVVTPIKLIIDSTNNNYGIEWWGIGNLKVIPILNDFKLQISVLFWRKNIMLLEKSGQLAKKRATKNPRNSKRKKRKFNLSRIRFLKILKSFKIKVWQVNIDTGNVILNSYLFPFCYLLSNKKRNLIINYTGKTDVKIEFQNSIGRMLSAMYLN